MARRPVTWRESFPPTTWTEIERAQGGNEAAVERLCYRYWRPAYSYLRSLKLAPETAEDLTQKLFLRVFTKPALAGLKLREHPFRSYLMQALRNLRKDLIRRSRAVKRAPKGCRIVSLEQAQQVGGDNVSAAEEDTPERAFGRAEAHGLLDEAIRSVMAECKRNGECDRFRMFFLAHIKTPPWSWEAIGERFAISGDAARGRVEVVRKRVGQHLRARIPPKLIHEFILAFEGRHAGGWNR